MATTIFQIEEGEFALALVNTGALGYLTTWNAPANKTAETAVLSDYDTDADLWYQQITSGQLVATPVTNTITTPATFGGPSVETPQPGVTSYSLQADFLQDVNVAIGLSQFLFENDTAEAYFLLGLNAGDPPRAIGRVRLQAGNFGGPARENLTSSVTLACVRKPSISFGDGTTSVITGTMVMDADGNVLDEHGNVVQAASTVGRSGLRAETSRRTAAASRAQRRARGKSAPPDESS